MRAALLIVVLSFALAPAALAERLTVFAAASLKTALDEVAAGFEAQTDHDVTLSYAGSSTLARQILAGASADIFIPANPDWMDAVHDELVPGSRRDLLGNRLVLVAPAQSEPAALSKESFATRLQDGPLAMALYTAVPAGIYGRAALEALDLWSAVESQVAQTDNVRAALALVALGEAPLGIVYHTDALVEARVSVVAEFDPATHPPIRYPVAALTDRDVSALFLSFLIENAGIFEKYGFEVLP